MSNTRPQKESQRDPKTWTPFKGKWKVTKLPRNSGVEPERTETNCRLDQRWIDF